MPSHGGTGGGLLHKNPVMMVEVFDLGKFIFTHQMTDLRRNSGRWKLNYILRFSHQAFGSAQKHVYAEKKKDISSSQNR